MSMMRKARVVARHPALLGSVDRDGKPLAEHAAAVPEVARVFGPQVGPA